MGRFKVNEEVCAKINSIYYRVKIKSIVPNTNGTRYKVFIGNKETIVNENDITKC